MNTIRQIHTDQRGGYYRDLFSLLYNLEDS